MDAAKGKTLLFSNKALVSLAIPLIFDQIFVLLAGMLDSAMVSTAGETAVSAISLVDSINALCVTIFAAIANGGVVVTAQYIGSRNPEKARQSANQLMYATVAISTLMMTVLLCSIPQTLGLVYGSLAPEVFENAKIYFFFTLLGYPFCAIGNGSAALLRSMAKSRPAFYLTLISNILNVIGNAILIYGFGLGVMGAAISTTFSRIVWAVAGLIMLRGKKLPFRVTQLWKVRLDFDIMKRVLNIGVANGMENGLFQVGKLLVSSLISTFGTVYIAAHSVAFTVCGLGWAIPGALGTLLLTVVGQCMGAGEKEQAVMYTKKIMKIGNILIYAVFGLIFLLRGLLVRIFSFAPETLDVCAYFVGVAAGATMLSPYVYSFLPVSSFRAAGDTKYAVTMAVSTMFIFRVGLGYLLGGFFGMGLIGIWIAMWADWTCRSVLNFVRLRNGKWLTKKVI